MNVSYIYSVVYNTESIVKTMQTGSIPCNSSTMWAMADLEDALAIVIITL